MLILTDDDFPAVRAALDITLDAEVLPDAIIALPMFIDTAEDIAVKRVPDWESLTGSRRLHLHNAVVKLTASLIAPSMADITSETFASGGQIYKRQPMNWLDVAARLAGEYEDEIQDVVDPDRLTTSDVPTTFTAVRGFNYRANYHRGYW